MTLPLYVQVSDREVILSDYAFWTYNERELELFCARTGTVQRGLLLEFATPAALTLFVLQYSSRRPEQ